MGIYVHIKDILHTTQLYYHLSQKATMNFSGSMSCSNLRDLRTIQPSYYDDDYDYPPSEDYYPSPIATTTTTGIRFMSPEQAIAENYYDVPRPAGKRRSHSVGGNMWKIHIHESLDSSSGHSSPVNQMSFAARQSLSAPASPVLLHHNNRAVEEFGVMSARDRSIYHSLGTSSSKAGKVCI